MWSILPILDITSNNTLISSLSVFSSILQKVAVSLEKKIFPLDTIISFFVVFFYFPNRPILYLFTSLHLQLLQSYHKHIIKVAQRKKRGHRDAHTQNYRDITKYSSIESTGKFWRYTIGLKQGLSRTRRKKQRYLKDNTFAFGVDKKRAISEVRGHLREGDREIPREQSPKRRA